jgi:hypothetical protein
MENNFGTNGRIVGNGKSIGKIKNQKLENEGEEWKMVKQKNGEMWEKIVENW